MDDLENAARELRADLETVDLCGSVMVPAQEVLLVLEGLAEALKAEAQMREALHVMTVVTAVTQVREIERLRAELEAARSEDCPHCAQILALGKELGCPDGSTAEEILQAVRPLRA